MEMEKQNEEEHHIDKKQKTEEHQQDVEAVKAPQRRVKKLSSKNKLDPSKGVGYYLNFGIKPMDITFNPPACSGRSPPYLTMYDEETSKILMKQDFRKLVASRRSNKLF